MSDHVEEVDRRQERIRERVAMAVEWMTILLVFFYWGSVPPPDVNESHYLTKARHFYQDDFCARDFFLNTADAHYAFYATFGWLAAEQPLPSAAWIGRVIAYGLLAGAWFRLVWSLVPAHGVAALSGALWLTLIDWGQMSGEWLVGGIEAKVPAYALVLVGLGDLVRSRWSRMWVALGAASALHVLVGGWSVVAAAGCLIGLPRGQRPGPAKWWRGLVMGGILSLAGLLPALALGWNATAEEIAAANRIYVYSRLPHHLLFSHFSPERTVRMLALVALLAAASWYFRREWSVRRVLVFGWVTLLLAVVGIAIEQIFGVHDPAPALMKFYWFRLADVMVPLGVALGGGIVVGRATEGRHPGRVGLTLLVTAAVAWGVWNVRQTRLGSTIPPADRQGLIRSNFRWHQWRDVCEWIDRNTPSDAVFLTPVYHQTFRWWAGRAEIVNRKDIPQDVRGILQWKTRLDDARWLCYIVREGSRAEAEDWTRRFQQQYRPDFWVAPHWQAVPESLMRLRYRNATYLVYEFPESDEADSHARGK